VDALVDRPPLGDLATVLEESLRVSHEAPP
jgi:hypothetical protein